MPRAERGTPKAISNQQKSKGLQRLRWYCQVCEKQCRDENGFKCHVQSEGHVRQMLLVGENPHRFVANYSRQFMGDFLQLLRTTHGEKRVNANHFYASQYIAKKDHIHMNSTRWKTLTEFITFLGHEGICKVENTEKGWFISWIDNSPEALKKRDANLKRERLEKGEADREDRLIQEQIERARQEALEKQLDRVDVDRESPGVGETMADDENSTSPGGSSDQETRMDDIVSSSMPTATEEPKPPVPLTITLQKPLIAASQVKKPANNPLKPKKSDNPLKSALKKDTDAKKPDTPTNENGKRPLPKSVEVMNDKIQRKKMRDDRHHRDRDSYRDRDFQQDRDHSRDRDYRQYDRPREVFVDRR